MKTRVLLVAIAVLPLAAAADEVFLKSGGQLSGRIVNRTAASLEVDIGAGRITVPTSHVLRIEEGRSALHEYEERGGKVAAGDVEGWLPRAPGPTPRGPARRPARPTTRAPTGPPAARPR